MVLDVDQPRVVFIRMSNKERQFELVEDSNKDEWLFKVQCKENSASSGASGLLVGPIN